jgi:hypothetical protein
LRKVGERNYPKKPIDYMRDAERAEKRARAVPDDHAPLTPGARAKVDELHRQAERAVRRRRMSRDG